MSLKYTCQSCGTPLAMRVCAGSVSVSRNGKTALAWTPEQIAENQRNLIQNIQRLGDMEDPGIYRLLAAAQLP